MFSLFRGAYGEITRKDEFFVAVLGLDGAGKTTYLERVKTLFDKHYRVRDLSKITSTVGLNHVRLVLRDCVANFWDLGGERELRTLWRSYLEECQAICFVVDSTDVARLQEVFNTLEGILSVERIRCLPLMILFNKCDLDEPQLLLQLAASSAPSPLPPQMADSPASSASVADADSEEYAPEAAAARVAPQHAPRLSSGGWHSFELEAEGGDCCGDALALATPTATTTTATTASNCGDSGSGSEFSIAGAGDNNGLMERFRRQYFNNHLSAVHQADAAIFSVSALQNTNVKRSITWLINAISPSTPMQRY